MSSSNGPNRGYGVVATLAGVIVVVAITVFITLAIERQRHASSVVSVGNGVVNAAIPLHREPSDSTETMGTLKAGEAVELLQYLPAKSMDSWVLVRQVQDPKIQGYAPLGNLAQLKTNNGELDVWHATQLLAKADTPDLKQRLATIGEMLKTPLPPSPAADQIYRTLATESLRLANNTVGNPDEARALIGSAETYLSRISAEAQVPTESDELRLGIQKVQIALGDIPDPEKPAEKPAPSPKDELNRQIKAATDAFNNGRYAKAAELAKQIAAKGQGKRELAAIVEQAKALQKKAENAQEEYEKVNIQNR